MELVVVPDLSSGVRRACKFESCQGYSPLNDGWGPFHDFIVWLKERERRNLYIAGWTGEVPARSHKPNDVGSIPTPATTFKINDTLVDFFLFIMYLFK